MSLVDWLANEHERFGRVLRFVTDIIGPGFLFGKQFGGIGGILRYQPEDGKEKKVTIDFEPFDPMNALLYPVHSTFNTEAMKELLQSDHKIGFIVMEVDGALFGTRCGNTREVLYKFTEEEIKYRRKGHERGEPLSPHQYAWLQLRKRDRAIGKTIDLAPQLFSDPATG
ncbi:hypothetical protein CRG98_037202 [Punica granatum]|nr:hypothetical protein CRG98_037202 [Punica granatum]